MHDIHQAIDQATPGQLSALLVAGQEPEPWICCKCGEACATRCAACRMPCHVACACAVCHNKGIEDRHAARRQLVEVVLADTSRNPDLLG